MIERFIGLVDGSLDPQEADDLRRELEANPDLRAEFEQYRRIVGGEKRVQSVTGDPSNDFLERVMTGVRNEPDDGLSVMQWGMLVMQYKKYRKVAVGAIATGGVVCLGLLMLEGRGEFEGDSALKLIGPSPEVSFNAPRALDYHEKTAGDLTTRFNEELTALGNQNLAQYEEKSSTKILEKMKRFAEDSVPEADHRALAGAPAPAQTSSRLTPTFDYSGLIGQVPPSVRRETWELGDLSRRPTVATVPKLQEQNQNLAFQLTTTAPHSTFSMDVDTGSYTNARKILRSGRRPSPDSVRPEEFINYFSYQHPTNTEKPFSTVYDIAPSPLTKGAKILRIGVKSRESIASDKPWNLVFLIDTSGSMADHNKLPMVKQALKLLATKMRASDRLSIVTYANGSQVALPPTSSGELERINAVIDGLAAAGGTNGHAGITLAYQAAQQGFIPNGVNRVILATDGDFNVGITNQEELISEIQRQRAKNISLTTIGVGEANYKEQLMEQLADKGDGNYFYLDTFDEARKVFDHDLVGTIETVAKDAKIQVEFNPAAVSQYRLIGYDNRALAAHEFTDNSVDAGEVGAGQSVTALYEVVLAGEQIVQGGAVETRYGPTPAPSPTPGPRPEELGFVRIRFQDPTSKEVEQLSFPMMTEQVQSSFAESSESVRFATAVAAFAEKLRGVAVNATYAEIAELAQGARGSDSDGRRAEFVALVREAGAMP